MPLNAPNQSLQRAMQILYAVSGVDDGRSVAQIAARVGIKVNTAGRYVRSLEQEKLLVRRERPLRFFLGPAIAELKHLEDSRHLLNVAGEVLARTQVKIPQASFSLVEMESGGTYTRLEVSAIKPGHLQLHRAQLHLPYEKASAMLFLAYGTKAERDHFFREHSFAEHGAPLWGTEQKLFAFFGEVVRKGYAEPDFPDTGLYRLAVPVMGDGGRVLAAVGAYIQWTESAHARRRLKKLALDAAKIISSAVAKPESR